MSQKSRDVLIVFALMIFSSVAFRFSFVYGSQKYFFSLVPILLPIIGGFLSSRSSVLLIGLFFILKYFLGITPLTLGIPTACSVAYWSTNFVKKSSFKVEMMRIFLSVLIPISCMLLFFYHPIGSKAFVYSLYWIIPILIYFSQFFGFNSFFLTALSSTFIAHAIGSSIWLLTIPMVPEKWIALIPIVAFERLAFAAGSFAVFRLIKFIVISFKFGVFARSNVIARKCRS